MPSLTNPVALGAKVALATALALLGCAALGVSDGVSASFVAVICTTPTVLSGLQRAGAQFLGSLIGGGVATLLAWLGWPTLVALPLSVGLSVGLIFPLGQGHAYAVAAFTAIYMHLLPNGDPTDTLTVRVAAVAIGGASAALVNVAVSAAFYASIFERRLDLTRAELARRIAAVARGESDADGLLATFPLLRDLAQEVAGARRELRWRRSAEAARLERAAAGVRAMTRIGHFCRDLALSVEESGAQLTDKDRALLHYIAARLRRESAPEPTPEGQIGQRALAALARWEATREPG